MLFDCGSEIWVETGFAFTISLSLHHDSSCHKVLNALSPSYYASLSLVKAISPSPVLLLTCTQAVVSGNLTKVQAYLGFSAPC